MEDLLFLVDAYFQFVIAGIWLAVAFWVATLASAKGYGWVKGALSGLIFGLLALIFYALMPDRKLQIRLQNIEERLEGERDA